MVRFGEIFGLSNKSRCISLLRRTLPLLPTPLNCSKAAVIIPLCIYDNTPSILYTRRALNLRLHPGEVCFPGGKMDYDSNETVVSTALRELEEEVGISAQSVEVWTVLCPCPTRSADHLIYAVVGFCGYFNSGDDQYTSVIDGKSTTLSVNSEEVDCVLFRSIDWLSNPRNMNYTRYYDVGCLPFTGVSSKNFKFFNQVNRFKRNASPFIIPIFGGGNSDWPKICGATAIFTYQLLSCLIPDWSVKIFPS